VLSRLRGYLRRFRLLEEFNTKLEPGKGRWNYSLVRVPVYRKGAYLIEWNNRVYRAKKQLFIPPVKSFIRLKAEGLKKRYEPGSEVSFRVRATDASGRGIATELSRAVTDAAIFSIQPQLVLDIEKYFYHAYRKNVVTASSFFTRFYGYSDKDRLAMSRRNFFVRAVFPEKVAEGERVRLGAVLHNLQSKAIDSRVSFQVSGGTVSGFSCLQIGLCFVARVRGTGSGSVSMVLFACSAADWGWRQILKEYYPRLRVGR